MWLRDGLVVGARCEDAGRRPGRQTWLCMLLTKGIWLPAAVGGLSRHTYERPEPCSRKRGCKWAAECGLEPAAGMGVWRCPEEFGERGRGQGETPVGF